jgi:hypothetical protein
MPQQNRLSLPSAPVRDQLNGRAKWNETRSQNGAHFFTLGYMGRKWDELLRVMLDAGVRTLLDIRLPLGLRRYHSVLRTQDLQAR